MLLAGDIGGTKTTLAIYKPKQGVRSPAAMDTYASARFTGLNEIVREFLSVHGSLASSIETAVFGVAGPVEDGEATITNLPWMLDETGLQQSLGIPRVILLNDLEAVANAIPHLTGSDVHVIQQGTQLPEAPIGVIAPGTGLGEAFLTWDGNRYRAHPSEGGHADFSPATPSQMGLLQHLREHFGHVSWERVCSGSGIPNIYEYLKDSGYADEPVWLSERLAQADDPSPAIVNTALEGQPGAELCVATLNTFVAILGAEAGNLALKVLARGGIYLGGGIPPKILDALTGERFSAAFRGKGRFTDMLSSIPVYIILHPEAALMGAASLGFVTTKGDIRATDAAL
jgi:glucokinase